jgi:protein SCO1/2
VGKKLTRRLIAALACAAAAVALLPECVRSSRANAQALGAETTEHAHQHAGHRRPEAAEAGAGASAPALSVFGRPIPDLNLTDQNGRRVRLYTDLMKGKVVVLSFFYTTCALVCDVQGRNLARLQAGLGGRLGKDVYLISVSRDPATDTPARLGAWAKEHGVRSGWSLVTGDVKEVGGLVARFLSDTVGPVESHSATVYVVNDRTGTWLASNGLAAPDELMSLIDRVSGRGGAQPGRR